MSNIEIKNKYIDRYYYTMAVIGLSTEELIIKIKDGDREAKTELWERVKKLVRYICRQYENYARRLNYDLDDLINTAWFGVERAIKAYDSEKGFAFATYASYHIRNVIKEQLGLKGKKQIVAESLNKPLFVSEGDEEITLLDTIKDERSEAAFDDAERRAIAEWLLSIRDGLSDKQYYVMQQYFKNKRTFSDIAKDLCVSPQRVVQLKNEAVKVLRKNKALNEYRAEFAYRHTGVEAFSRTQTSSTEWAAIRLEEKRTE